MQAATRLGIAVLLAAVAGPSAARSARAMEPVAARSVRAMEPVAARQSQPARSEGERGSASALDSAQIAAALEADPWSSPEALARGERMLRQLLDSAGGLEAWQALPGLSYQLLETLHVQTDAAAGAWAVHDRVPRLAAFETNGDGYLYSEFARYEPADQSVHASFRREVRALGAAWAEQDGAPERGPEASQRARDRCAREFLLGGMPFSLAGGRAQLCYAGPAVLRDRPLEAYRLRLREPVRLEEHEAISECTLYVDAREGRVVQLGYELRALDRDDFAQPLTRASVDFEGRLPVGRIFLPERRYQWHERGPRQLEWHSALPLPEAPGAEALRRPWISGSVWRPPRRANHWDAPAPRDPETRPATQPAPGLEGGRAGRR